MDQGLMGTLGGVAAVLFLLLITVLVLLLAGRRRTRAELEASRREVTALQDRLDRLAEDMERAVTRAAATPVVPQAEYLITTAGTGDDGALDGDTVRVPDRAVASVALGEPLLKAAAFGFGVRRALSAESRNRIGFEMKRELRRSRKQRRREMRAAWRDARRRAGEAA
jgi:hypothetical protein